MFSLFLQDARKVLLYSVVLGAGLPVVYAVGVRSLSLGSASSSGSVSDHGTVTRTPVGTAIAGICFLVVVLAVIVGLTYIFAAGQGKMLSFDHVYPTIVAKS